MIGLFSYANSRVKLEIYLCIICFEMIILASKLCYICVVKHISSWLTRRYRHRHFLTFAAVACLKTFNIPEIKAHYPALTSYFIDKMCFSILCAEIFLEFAISNLGHSQVKICLSYSFLCTTLIFQYCCSIMQRLSLVLQELQRILQQKHFYMSCVLLTNGSPHRLTAIKRKDLAT